MRVESLALVAQWFEMEDRDKKAKCPQLFFLFISFSFSIFIWFFDIRNYFFSVFKNANANQCGSQTRFELGPKRALDSGDENRFFLTPWPQARLLNEKSTKLEPLRSAGVHDESRRR